MIYEVEFAPAAREDLHRLYTYLLDRAGTIEDLALAEHALAAIETALEAHLAKTPFIYRKANEGNSLRRELIIPFSATGYVAPSCSILSSL